MGNNKTPILLKALILPFVSPSTKDFFTKFIKAFIKLIQTQAQA